MDWVVACAALLVYWRLSQIAESIQRIEGRVTRIVERVDPGPDDDLYGA